MSLKKSPKSAYHDFYAGDISQQVTVYLNGFVISATPAAPMSADGVIALQLHGGAPMKVRFRDVELRPANDPKLLN